MKKKNFCLCHAKGAFSRIHLIDKCLILFMLVLLGQSAYSLFCHSTTTALESNTIDIIIRTSTAAIFGYFLSANFIKNASLNDKEPIQNQAKEIEIAAHSSSDKVRDHIGFTATDMAVKNESDYGNIDIISAEKHDRITVTDMQIVTAATVGLFCLVVLIVIRNSGYLVDSPSTIATVAQFRDFISGSVGFLIGCPTIKVK